MSTKILRLPKVICLTGLSRSTIFNRIAAGDFPSSVSLGGRSVGWVGSEVDEWIDSQIRNSRSEVRPVKEDAS